MPLSSWVVTFIMAVLLITAQVTIKYSVQTVTLALIREQPLMSILAILRQPWFWLGIAISGVLFLLTLYNYLTTSLNVFAPALTIIYMVLLLLLSSLVLHESVTALKLCGYLLMIVGIAMIGMKNG